MRRLSSFAQKVTLPTDTFIQLLLPCRTSLMLTGLQKMTSASLCNASIANKSARRILLARSSTFSSAPALQTILMPRVLKQALEMEGRLHQMVSTGHRP